MSLSFDDAVARHYLSERWIQYIRSHKWHWYCHLTFPRSRPEETARDAFCSLIHNVNRWEFGQRYYRNSNKGVTWIVSDEMQKRDAIHFHAVIGDHSIDPVRGIKWWARKYGDAKIVTYDPAQNGAAYLVKRSFDLSNIDVCTRLATFRPH